MVVWWQAAIVTNLVALMVGYVSYRVGYTSGWHKGSSDTAAYVANHSNVERIEQQVRCNTCKFVHWQD